MKKLFAMILVFTLLLSSIGVQAGNYPEYRPDAPIPERPHLTKTSGVFYGVNGKETYYNKDMTRIISIMRGLGYSEDEYPYYIREDGAKCLGSYVMCAADLKTRPRGTILETSLGYAIVCDTGDFTRWNKTQIDLATDW